MGQRGIVELELSPMQERLFVAGLFAAEVAGRLLRATGYPAPTDNQVRTMTRLQLDGLLELMAPLDLPPAGELEDAIELIAARSVRAVMGPVRADVLN